MTVLRVEEKGSGCRCSLALSAVSSFVRVEVHHGPPLSPPSLTPPCRITAAGSSSRTPCTRPGVHDPRTQQRMLPQDFSIAFPRQPSPACTAAEPFSPDPANSPIELPETAIVRRASVILVVASELGIQGLLLLIHRVVAVLLAPCGDGMQSSAEPLAHRLPVHCEFPLSAACVNVRQPQEIKRGRFLSLSLRVSRGVPPKF